MHKNQALFFPFLPSLSNWPADPADPAGLAGPSVLSQFGSSLSSIHSAVFERTPVLWNGLCFIYIDLSCEPPVYVAILLNIVKTPLNEYCRTFIDRKSLRTPLSRISFYDAKLVNLSNYTRFVNSSLTQTSFIFTWSETPRSKRASRCSWDVILLSPWPSVEIFLLNNWCS